MVYLELAILGWVLFLITSVADYYWSRLQTDERPNTDTPKSPSEVPVGSKPSGYRIDSIWSKIEPRYIGYITAVGLQLPFLASRLGWL